MTDQIGPDGQYVDGAGPASGCRMPGGTVVAS